MKLLPKKQVAAQVAQQTKEQIDKGLALAGKIDVLRETLLNEEQRLNDFRKQSTATVQEEIDTKIRERDSLLGEIQRRKDELAELKKPLDSAWEEVEIALSQIEKEKQKLSSREIELTQAIALNIQRERSNEQESVRAKEELRLASEARDKAEELKRNAAQHLMKARTEATSIISRANEREEAVILREEEVEKQEKKNKDVTKQQEKTAKELEIEARQIKDQYETLQRNINRLK